MNFGDIFNSVVFDSGVVIVSNIEYVFDGIGMEFFVNLKSVGFGVVSLYLIVEFVGVFGIYGLLV